MTGILELVDGVLSRLDGNPWDRRDDPDHWRQFDAALTVTTGMASVMYCCFGQQVRRDNHAAAEGFER